ncbi:MAG TPA: pantoate--beta-alanine ligase [Nitrospirota bacterium]|nr:pantoate--beta-alanine ligase [Nitrospirota bacterium]
MKVIEDISEMHNLASQLRQEGRTIGFVPTMGALHQGHLSLMYHAKKVCDVVIVSIFVNPAQFGPKEDLDKYPQDIEGDTEKTRSAAIDILFTPSPSEIYPDGFRTYVSVEGLSNRLCGNSRPGHFRGVATVVLKLLNIVKPHKSFFGQKDYQQTVIIKRMVKDLNVESDIVVLPTVREADGLAMSSRNQYLNSVERQAAAVIYRSLCQAYRLFEDGVSSTDYLRETICRIIKDETAVQTEYVSVVHPETLEEETVAVKGSVIAIAARTGNTRLIDNIIL